MDKVRRLERIVALTKMLVDRPYHLFALSQFSTEFGVAKSTLSEDIASVKNGLSLFDLGTLETVAGAAGGVRFLPGNPPSKVDKLLKELALDLSMPDRIIPGGFLYMSDVLFMPQFMVRAGELFMHHFCHTRPNFIMTVETKGIPLAFATARAFDLPLVTVRRDSKVTEGPTVSINYVTGPFKRIQTMTLPRRAIPEGSKVLIIDDFMKAGGTAKGMMDLAQEVGASVVGTGVLVATAEPREKLVADYMTLLILYNVDEHNKKVDIRPAAVE